MSSMMIATTVVINLAGVNTALASDNASAGTSSLELSSKVKQAIDKSKPSGSSGRTRYLDMRMKKVILPVVLKGISLTQQHKAHGACIALMAKHQTRSSKKSLLKTSLSNNRKKVQEPVIA